MKTPNSVSQKLEYYLRPIQRKDFRNLGQLKSMNMKSISMYSTQYLVGAPFAWITAAMRRGMESISLWHCSGVMRAQVALIVAFSSSALLGLAYRIFLFTIPHRFSMGLRSGEFAGQLRTGIPWSLNQVPGTLPELWQVPSPVGKWNLHLHKVGQQQEAWSALKLPGIRLCWPWTSENTVDQHQQMTWHPQTITDCGKLYTGPQAPWILCLSSLPPDSGTLISKGNAKLLSSENITLDHSAAVQSFLSLAQARRFWRCLLFKSGLTQGMRQLKPMSCIRLCVVVLEALTPAAVHSLWISPTFWMGFVSQSSPGCGYPYCLYTFFSTTSFPSLCLSINVLGHRALWTASLFCNDLLCLALLVQGVNGCLLDNCQVRSLPHDCVAYRTRLRDHLKAFAGVLS